MMYDNYDNCDDYDNYQYYDDFDNYGDYDNYDNFDNYGHYDCGLHLFDFLSLGNSWDILWVLVSPPLKRLLVLDISENNFVLHS